MGYLLISHAAASFPKGGLGGWKAIQSHAVAPTLAVQFGHDVGLRVRNIKQPSSLFSRDWTDANDGALPMPFSKPDILRPAPVLFDLTLPATSVNWTLTPSPVPFNLDFPSVITEIPGFLTPSPVVFSLLAAAVQINQGVLPNPVPFSFTPPHAFIGRSLSPDPVLFNLTIPSVTPNHIMVPNAVLFSLTPAATTTYNNLLNPNPVIFSLTPPTPLVLHGKILLPSPVVVTLLPVTPTLIPGEVTVEPGPVRLYMRLPYTTGSYFIASPAEQVVKSVTYYVRLSNAVVGYQTIPASSIQASSQSLALYELDNVETDVSDPEVGPRDEMSIQVPNGAAYTSILTAFLAEPTTTIAQVLERVTYTNGYVSDRTIAVSELLTVNRNRGPRNDTTTIRCSGQSRKHATRTVSVPQTIVRESRSDDEGRLSARLHYDLNEVRSSRVDGVTQLVTPGDTVTVDGQTYVVAKVSVNLSSTDRYLDISSRSA